MNTTTSSLYASLDKLRLENPGRLFWVGDEDMPVLDTPPPVRDVYTAFLVIGYETMGERVVRPWVAMSNLATDIEMYALGRGLKDPEDAAEVFFERSNRPYINEFLRQSFGLLEEAHAQGLQTKEIIEEIKRRIPGFEEIGHRAYAELGEDITVVDFCKMVWREALKAETAFSE